MISIKAGAFSQTFTLAPDHNFPNHISTVQLRMKLVILIPLALLAVACVKADASTDVYGYITVDLLNAFWYDLASFPVYPARMDLAFWNAPRRVHFPRSTQVIAIKARTRGNVAGILASFDDGSETNRQWKCTSKEPQSVIGSPYWRSSRYDDSDWETAHVMGNNHNPQTDVGVPWPFMSQFSKTAKWIWTSPGRKGEPGFSDTVWCRLDRSKISATETPPATIAPPPQGDTFLGDIYVRHNIYRDQHGASSLAVDSAVQQFAQDYCDRLAGNDAGLVHSKESGDPDFADSGYGENLYRSGGSEVTGQMPVDAWYGELTDPGYNFANPGYSSGTGHFTQVVWKGSTGVGCGRATAASGKVYVCCNYSPGQTLGQFEANVLPAQ